MAHSYTSCARRVMCYGLKMWCYTNIHHFLMSCPFSAWCHLWSKN